MTDIQALAEMLDEAALRAVAVPQPSESHDLTLEDAYAVQHASVARRRARGEAPAGIKMGPTTRPAMRALGIAEPLTGRLTAAMQVPEGGEVALARYVGPRVEVEIAFLLRRRVDPAEGPAALWRAVEAVAPALEIADSRYPGYRFSLTDLVADNCAAAGFVLGAWQAPERVAADGWQGLAALDNLGVVLSFDGRPVETVSTAAVLGGPFRMLAHGVRLTEASGEPLQAGDVVMSGGAHLPLPMRPGLHVQAEVAGLGRLGFTTAAAA